MSSSLKLADALSKVHDGICVFGSDFRPTFANEKASQLLETADDEFQAKIRLAFADGCGRRFEHFHIGLDRWFEHQSYLHPDGRLTIISRDITSRRRIEAALRANEERFRRIIDSNIIGVIVVEGGIITEANDGFLKMVGHTRREQVTRQLHWREMTPPEYHAADAKARIELKTEGVFSPYEKEFFRKDGSRAPILISGVSIEERPNTPETLCLAMDLSEKQRAEERVRLIVEYSKILASSLECDKTLPEVAEFVVSKTADTCSIFVRDDDELTRVASASRTPVGQSIHTDAEIENVMATGRTYAVVSPVSCIVSPIVARNQT